MKEKVKMRKYYYEEKIDDYISLISNGDVTEQAKDRMSIEINCYRGFITELDKILQKDDNISSSKEK
jgi:hypothetical protein